MLAEQLVRPFGYLVIRHPKKWVVDWVYPGAMALCVVFFISIGKPDSLIDRSGAGVVSLILSFIQSLPGFYIAALAAIATFGRPDIDEILPAPTPKVLIRYRGVDNLVDLTRRRFLAMLFAFLTAESIVVIVLSIFIVSYAGGLVSFYRFGLDLRSFVVLAVSFVYFLIFFQMIVTTFWGLYYLGYKLHE